MSAVLARDAVPAPIDRAHRRALFLLDTWSSFEQQQPMAQALGAAGWDCRFMPLRGSQLGGPTAQIAQLWPLVPEPTGSPDRAPAAGPPPQRGRLRALAGRALRVRGMSAVRELILAWQMAGEWRRWRSLARRRIAEFDPDCVVTAQDRLEAALPVVAAAKDLRVPVILAPCAGLYMPDGCAYLRKDDPSVRLDPAAGTRWGQLLLNRLVGWLQPDQVFASRWGRMLYQPAGWQLAAWMTGLRLPSFWYQGGRFADVVVVSGEDERRVCERAGIPPARVAAIGSPALQLQYERRRTCERLRGELGVGRGDMLVIVALTQMWEHGMLDEASHFAFVDRLLATLSGRNAHVVISLHPKMDRARYEPRIRAAGLRLADRPLIEILAAADLFIAGAYSTTVRWAMAAGIPTANLDLWALEESTYADMPDYPTVRSWEALESWLDACLAAGRQVRPLAAPPMGLICDGQFREKFVALVERMAGGRA
jgi:hypothetical protein